MGVFDNFFGKEKEDRSIKHINDAHQDIIGKLSEDGILTLIKKLQPTEREIQDWFGTNIYFIFKQYNTVNGNVVVEYIMDNYKAAVEGVNSPNYFLLNCIEFNKGKLFFKYFDRVTDTNYPFAWDRMIIGDALEYNRWWVIVHIWDRLDITAWHPLDRPKIILTALDRTEMVPGQNSVKRFIKKCKANVHIQNYAAEHFNDEPRWTEFVSDDVHEMFLF